MSNTSLGIGIGVVIGIAAALGGQKLLQETGFIERHDRELGRAMHKKGALLPLEQIHAKALEVKPGKVIGSEFEAKGSRYTYEVDVLDAQGGLWEIEISAKTGEVIRSSEEND